MIQGPQATTALEPAPPQQFAPPVVAPEPSTPAPEPPRERREPTPQAPAPQQPEPLIDTEPPRREPTQAFDFNFDDEADRKRSQPSRSAAKSGLSLLPVAGIATFCSVVFFVLGFFFGKSGNFTRTIPSDAATPPEATVSPAELPSTGEFIPQIPSDSPLPTADQSGAMAALEAFLSAKSWAARSAYVAEPSRVMALMESDTLKNGDGPIPYERLELIGDDPQRKTFALQTLRHPLPFSVVVMKDELGWGVDWEGFQEFYNDTFETFARGGKGPTKGVFRLFLKPAPGESDPLNPARFIVSAMHSTNTYQVSTQQDSEVRKQLAVVLRKIQKDESGDLKSALEGAGLPFMLELSRTGSVNPSLKLERVVAFSWLSPKD